MDAGALWALYRLYVGAERFWTLERFGRYTDCMSGQSVYGRWSAEALYRLYVGAELPAMQGWRVYGR